MTQILQVHCSAEAMPPMRASLGAAGLDIMSIGAQQQEHNKSHVMVYTGLRVSFPDDHVLLVYPRSNLGFRHGITLANSVGVIDSDYRGEIKLMFHIGENTIDEALELLGEGKRVAQCILQPIPKVLVQEVDRIDELGSTARGEGGFGSTGA